MHEFKPKVWMMCPLCGKQSPMPDPDRREWVGLTDEEQQAAYDAWQQKDDGWGSFYALIEAKLKEKNNG